MPAKMNDAFHAGDGFFDLGEIGEIGGDKIIAASEIGGLADVARPKMRIDAAQNPAQSRADIAGSAGNENVLHHFTPIIERTRNGLVIGILALLGARVDAPPLLRA